MNTAKALWDQAVMEMEIPFGDRFIPVKIPEGSDVLRMAEPEALSDPANAIRDALDRPIMSASLAAVAREKADRALKEGRSARACIVVSDNTRPVPYKGPGGLLEPILRTLSGQGYAPEDIILLVAAGTHRAMTQDELALMLGHEAMASGVRIVQHNCLDEGGLVHIGTTARGTVAKINKLYVQADLKILTGLVESHFMAGASGGRKAICPGIFGEQGTFIFHSASLMAHPNARDLCLEDNPVHQESLAVAKMAGADFIANVTIDGSFRITGVFCGDLEAAHAAAVAKLKSYVGIPIRRRYDLVVTHGGFVAVNHYQAAKAAVAALGAVKDGGGLILAANNKDPNPVGSNRYRAVLSLLKLVGAEALERVLASPDWPFVPEQWQVQEWAKVFKKISFTDFVYYAPQLDSKDWRDLPGTDGRSLLDRGALPGLGRKGGEAEEMLPRVVEASVHRFMLSRGFGPRDVAEGRFRIAFLADGPYGIPLPQEEP